MCGISLILSLNQNEQFLEQTIKKMVGSMQHRGPDMTDHLVDIKNNCALGHNRLSILDLSLKGKQPLASYDQSHWITYNGEVYNFESLREDLVHEHCPVSSKTDTEVILDHYVLHGAEAVKSFNGMWAFAILDTRKQELFISRDRPGMKPLYYYYDGKLLLVASEIKAILASGLVPAEVNMDGLVEYFSFQNIISDQTLFKGIRMLPPGHNMTVCTQTLKMNIVKYWDLAFADKLSISDSELRDNLVSTLSSAINRTMIADVPVGATLSGGIDSTTILAYLDKARLESSQAINTFTGYFDSSHCDPNDRSFNEHLDARMIAQQFHTNHHELCIGHQDVIDTLDKIVWHLEDPKVGMSYTFYLISQLVSKHVTVNLSGTGGDELFGGYPWRYQLLDEAKSYQDYLAIYYPYWCRLVNDQTRPHFFTPACLSQMDLGRPFEQFQAITNNYQNASPHEIAIYFEFKTFLHGMLMVEDKLGMAASLETRFPLLDSELVDFSQRVPLHKKYSNKTAKLLLREVLHGKVPDSILNKKKQGFTPPDMSWYRGQLSPFIAETLLGKDAMIHEYIRRDFIQKVLDEHQVSDCRLMIWSLLFFEKWLQIFLGHNTVLLR